MATEQRTGFRLPWSPDGELDPAPDGAGEVAEPDTPETVGSTAAHEAAGEAEATEAESGPETVGEAEAAEALEAAGEPAPDPATPAPARRTTGSSSKFRADLTKAMHAAAEQARQEAVDRFAADAKEHVESIHAGSASEADDLRKATEEDLGAIREWSKAEIARIREEADGKTVARKARLERELEAHAAEIEARIDRVQALTDAYETELASFFEALMAEEDPTVFATMAERLPEPPSFDAAAAPAADALPEAAPEAVAVPIDADPEAEPVVSTPATTGDGSEGAEGAQGTDAAEPAGAPAAIGATEAEGEAGTTESGATAWPDEGRAFDAAPTETPIRRTDIEWPAGDFDPRLTAMGLSPDAAAEAEAAAFAGLDGDGSDPDVEIPVIGDDALAARIAGLVPGRPDAGGTGETVDSRVIVTGLVSVAAIAGFKRHLSRLPGVGSVGVTSGPEGEFVFAVGHGTDVNLRDAIPSIPGFAARVTGGDGTTIEVSAHDPEADG